MHSALAWLGEALASKDLVQFLTHYLLRDGMIYASNGRLVAGHPIEFKGDPVLVPGAAFNKVLEAVPADGELVFRQDETHLHVRHGKFRAKLRLLSADLWPFESLTAPAGEQGPIPPALLSALADLRPFISDNATQPWASCIAFMDGCAVATNNVAIGCRWVGPGADGRMLPVWATDFLLSRAEGLRAWAWGPTAASFHWEQGAFLKTVLVEGSFPSSGIDMIRNAFGEHFRSTTPEAGLVPITDPFRQAYLRVARLTEGREIAFHPDRIEGGREELLRVEEDSDLLPMPEGHDCAIFDPNILTPILKQASHWNPAAWPRPAQFVTPSGVLGLVLGRHGE